MKFRALPPPFLPCSRRPQWLFKLSLQVGSQFPSSWATFPVPLIFSLSWWFYHIFSFSPPLHSSSCPGICSQKSEASGNLHLYTASGVCALLLLQSNALCFLLSPHLVLGNQMTCFQLPAKLCLFRTVSFPSSVFAINVTNAFLRKYRSFNHTCPSRSCHFYFLYSKGLQPLGTICGLLGTSCTAGGEQQANKWSLICSYSHCPLLAAPPELRLASPTVTGLCPTALVPDDVRWSWSSGASTVEQPQIQVISRSACAETAVNQLLAAHIRTLSASGKWWWAVYFIIYHSVTITGIKCTVNVLESPQNRPSSPVHGKIVCPRTRSQCQKQGPLLISIPP